jgi:hypothetical protein
VERISSEAALEYDGHPSEDFVHYSINGETLYVSKFFNPIPLTPEILEKAGFNMEGKYIWLKIDEAFELCTFASGTPGVGLYFEGQWLGDTFNYLHQIQNLFFALTGEELKIEL